MGVVATSSLLALAWVAGSLAKRFAGVVHAQSVFMDKVGESFRVAMKATNDGWEVAMKDREAASRMMMDLSLRPIVRAEVSQ